MKEYRLFNEELFDSIINKVDTSNYIRKQNFNDFFGANIYGFDKDSGFRKKGYMDKSNVDLFLKEAIFMIVLFRIKGTNIFSIETAQVLGDVVFANVIDESLKEIVYAFDVCGENELSKYYCNIAVKYIERYEIKNLPKLRGGFVMERGNEYARSQIQSYIDKIINHTGKDNITHQY